MDGWRVKCTTSFLNSRGGGYFHIRRSEGLASKFTSEIRVGASNFPSKNIDDKYPKFCPLNFRYNPNAPKIVILSQLLHLVVTQRPKFFLLFGEIAPNFASNLDIRSKLPPPPPRPPNMEVPPPGLNSTLNT